MQLERENEHLKRVVETYRTGAPPTDDRMKDLEEDNLHLHENLSQYKNMITKLTKVGVAIVLIVIALGVLIHIFARS